MIESQWTLLGSYDKFVLTELERNISSCINECSALISPRTTIHYSSRDCSIRLRYFVCDTCLVFGNNTLSCSQTNDHILKSGDGFYIANFICTSSVPSTLLRKNENHYGTLMVTIWTKRNKGCWPAVFYLCISRRKSSDGSNSMHIVACTVYPKKYAHGFVVLCFVVVMQSFIMNSHEVFIHIHQGCFAGTGAIVRLPQCQWSKPDGYGKISQCITTTKHSKAKTVCIFPGIYCMHCLCCAFAVLSLCCRCTIAVHSCYVMSKNRFIVVANC